MKSSVYNILWADNNSDSLRKSMEIRRAFECDEYTINVLSYSHTTGELERDFDVFKDRVDAVVFGDNLKKNELAEQREYNVREVEVSGLIHAYSLMELFNRHREIPFIFCTDNAGRANPLCNRLGLTYFTDGDRIVGKDYDQLSNKLRSEIDHINSPEHRVEVKYKVLLDMAASVEESKRALLFDLLLKEEADKLYEDGDDSMFNPLRKIMESLVERCGREGIIPQQITELNEFKGYFVKKLWKDQSYPYMYSPKEDVMPLVMVRTLESLIDVLQDGSHEKPELSLYATKYVRDTQTPFVPRACMYQVMDVIRWYNLVKKQRNDFGEMWYMEKNMDYREIQELPSDYCAKEASEYEGKMVRLEKDEWGTFHCAECSIHPDAISKNEIKVGEKVILFGVKDGGFRGYSYKAKIKKQKTV